VAQVEDALAGQGQAMGHAGILAMGAQQGAKGGTGRDRGLLDGEMPERDAVSTGWGRCLGLGRGFLAASSQDAEHEKGRTEAWRAGHSAKVLYRGWLRWRIGVNGELQSLEILPCEFRLSR